jgi:hypothetical protein
MELAGEWMRKAWLRRGLIGAAALALVLVIAFAVAVPPLARYGLETVASRELGRAVTVQSISANPFTLSATLKGLAIAGSAVAGQSDEAPLLTVERLRISLSALSIVHRAAVVDALEIDAPHLRIARLQEQRFNFTDILERLQARPRAKTEPTEDSPARFALYNVQLRGGRIDFDDRVAQRQHQVTGLALGVPFVSSLPTHVSVTVEPALAARVDGTPIEVRGKTTPFERSQAMSVDLKLDGLDIPTYLGYVPVPLNFALPTGKLDTDLTLSFRPQVPARDGRPARPQEVVLSGSLGVRDVSLQAPRAAPQPLLQLASLQLRIGELAPLVRRLVIDELKVGQPQVWVGIGRDGALNWTRFAQTAAGRSASSDTSNVAASNATSSNAAPSGAAPPPAAAAPWQVTLKTAAMAGGMLHFSDDRQVQFKYQLREVQIAATNISTVDAAPPGQLGLKASLDQQGTVSLDGSLALAPLKGELNCTADDVQLRATARYLAQVFNGTLEGSTAVRGKLVVVKEGEQVQIALRDVAIDGRQIVLRGPQGAQLSIARLAMQGGELDFTKRAMRAASITIDTPRVAARRLPDGSINWQQVAKADVEKALRAQAPADGKEGSKAAAVKDMAPPSWGVTLDAIELLNGNVAWEDASVTPAAKMALSALHMTIRNVTPGGTTPMQVSLRSNSSGVTKGQLALDGSVRPQPLQTDLRVNLRNVDLAPARSYLNTVLNAVFLRGEVTARSRVQLAAQQDGPMRVKLDGGLRLANLQVLNPDGQDDLLKWQALDVDRIALRLGEGPADVQLGKIALSDFFARVIISAEGRLNLADVVRRRGSDAEAAAAPTASAQDAKQVAQPANAKVKQTAVPEAAQDSAPRPRIRIERIEVTRGNINFTDNFIRPNYTANLTEITGSVTTLASDATEPATLQLAGSIDREAPVTIDGTLNPLAPKLFLDIKGSTKGVDLPRFTPYAAKYAGYPITKGKLSMEVSYRLDNDQLKANNHLFLDQLTFGERVDSPTATKLPVLLAVALLKNTRGEIDINLPVSGSLNDPKFSVGGIILQVIVNLLAQVVTSPFALLGAAFGSDAELGYIDFAPGTATLGAGQVQRVDTLGKALNDRPALRLDIIGRAYSAADTDGLKRAQLEARLRAAKVRQQLRAGGAPAAPDSVTIEPAERNALLAAVYADDKVVKQPRNAIGIARTLPAAEMEQLLLESMAVTPSELRILANARAAAVRDHLEQQAKVPRERLFLVEPKIDVPDEGSNAKAVPTRVDFALK